MTDSESLFRYRMDQAEATIGLQNAHKFVDRIKSYVAGA